MKFPSRTANLLKYLFLASKSIVQWHMSGPNLQMCKHNIIHNNRIHFHVQCTPLFVAHGRGSASLVLQIDQGRVKLVWCRLAPNMPA